MKKLALLMCLLLTGLMLTGCQPATSSVSPAPPDDWDQWFEEVLGPGTEAFELKMAKDVRSLHINLYQLTDGRWEPIVFGGLPVTEREGPVKISILENVIVLGDSSQVLHYPREVLTLENGSKGAARLQEKVTLEWDKEVPVFLYIETSADSVSLALSDFYHPEKLAHHERVFCLTVMVSQEDVK